MQCSNYIYLGASKESINFNKYVKLGGCSNPTDRLGTYQTGFAIHPFQYESVLRILEKAFTEVEKLLRKGIENTQQLGGTAGTEWFGREFMNQEYIEAKLRENNIPYEILSDEDIENINRTVRRKTHSEAIKRTFDPRTHQREAFDKANIYFATNNIGCIIWPCGAGKTLEALYISSEGLKLKNILICVPSKNLLNQWREVINKFYPHWKNDIIINGNGNNINMKELEKSKKIVISTYHSVGKILKLQKTDSTTFDIKIGDECHHLVGELKKEENLKKFTTFHQIKSHKTLFLTATAKKYLELNANKVIYSMHLNNYFGEVIDERTVNWAIENGYLCDYKLIDVVNKQSEINIIMDGLNIIQLLESGSHKKYIDKLKQNAIKNETVWRDKIDELFMASYLAVKSIHEEGLSKLLLYTNLIVHADICKYFIQSIINSDIFQDFDKKNFYNNDLHSDKENIEQEINTFKKCKKGIVSCVNIFNEGHDDPTLDGVVFAEAIKSTIAIIQKCLRPHRKNPDNPSKMAYIIIPRLDCEEAKEEKKIKNSFDKIENIGGHLRNVDENIYSRLLTINDSKRKYKKGMRYISKKCGEDSVDNDTLKKIKTRIRMAGNVKLTLKKFYGILTDNGIYNRIGYLDNFIDVVDSSYVFPREITHQFSDFDWRFLDANKDTFYTKPDCIEKLLIIRDEHEEYIDSLEGDSDDIMEFITRIDKKIPNRNLYRYYGGDISEFLLFD